MSLAVTVELLKKGKGKSIKECLEMEYKLSQMIDTLSNSETSTKSIDRKLDRGYSSNLDNAIRDMYTKLDNMM